MVDFSTASFIPICSMLSSLPDGVCEWVQKQPLNDGTKIAFESEVLPDGEYVGSDGRVWMKKKPGSHLTVCLMTGLQEYTQRFVSKDGVYTPDFQPLQG